MTQALYRQWRPLTWSEVVGQEHVVRTLQNAVKAERLSHAYLFSGPRGTGKTSTARILAKAVNCLAESLVDRPCNECKACVAVNEGRYLDLIEIDAASNTSVDDVRDLRDRINFAPNEGRFKVYIVDEVHMLSTAAFNALLKTLEEPPPHAIFILATTEVHKIPATVLSRCQRHEFRRIPVDEILSYLEDKIQESGFEVEPEALMLIARQATGSLRDATSLLDQLVSMGEVVTLERAQEVLGTVVDEAVGDLVQAIADGEIGTGLEIINKAIDGGIDPRQFARQVVEWLRSLLLITAGEKVNLQSQPMIEQAESMGTGGILPAMHAFSQATRGERTAWQPGLALELAFMETIQRSIEARVGSPDIERAADSEHELESEPEVGDPPNGEPGLEAAPKVLEEGSRSAKDAVDGRGESHPGSDFQRVLDAWPELLTAAYGRDPQTQALLNSCKPLGVDDNALVLGFQSDLLREKMEKGHNQQIVTEALGEVLDAELDVSCVLLKDWGSNPSTAPSPPLPEGGMVAAALRDLGAEVIDYGPETETDGADPDRKKSTEDNKDEEER
ncbi:MAG: DNA polymerase III subunit gamma/tau [Anaerolineae bacterium]|nr:MAG: DNA polymerase III subunit gamma/tau [Anaerolineae bacterium]